MSSNFMILSTKMTWLYIMCEHKYLSDPPKAGTLNPNPIGSIICLLFAKQATKNHETFHRVKHMKTQCFIIGVSV